MASITQSHNPSLASNLSNSRRVLLFPFGNSNAPPNDSVSIYLDYVDPKTSDTWHACAQFALVLSNPTDPTNFVVSRMLCSLSINRYVCSRNLQQTRITDLFLKSVIGVLQDFTTYASYSKAMKLTLGL